MWDTIVYRILDIFLILFFLPIVKTYISPFQTEKRENRIKELPAWGFYAFVQLVTERENFFYVQQIDIRYNKHQFKIKLQ